MRFWFQKSEKEAGTAYVGAEHKGVSAFCRLHVGKREILEAATFIGASATLRRFQAKRRSAAGARRRVRQREKLVQKAMHKQPKGKRR